MHMLNVRWFFAFLLCVSALHAQEASPRADDRATGEPRVSSGTTNFIGRFVNSTDLGNSSMFDIGGRVGLGTTAPLDYFHVAFNDPSGTFTGYAVQNLSGAAGAYSGMLFYDQDDILSLFQGFNNSSHEYRINNVASNGSISFMLASNPKFKIRTDGDVDTFGNIRKGGAMFVRTFTSGDASLGLGALAVDAGSGNTAAGEGALAANSTGCCNTALGAGALAANTSGSENTAVGNGALQNSTGSYNIAFGNFAGSNVTSGSHNIMIANQGLSGDDSVIRIGTNGNQTLTFIAGISGTLTGTGHIAVVDSNGQLGTVSSSRRYKEDIADMGEASSGLLRLRPVTFRYKKPYMDGSKPLDYGLIAEEVAEVYPELVVRNKDGEIETVQYYKLTPMLLNELQKHHRSTLVREDTLRIANDKINAQVEAIAIADHAIQSENQRIDSLDAQLAVLESLLSIGRF